MMEEGDRELTLLNMQRALLHTQGCTDLQVDVENDETFNQDLIKAMNPIDLLKPIGAKIPPPLDTAFKKALELAAFAPLLPIIDKLKNQDLEGAIEILMSGPVLKVIQNMSCQGHVGSILVLYSLSHLACLLL